MLKNLFSFSSGIFGGWVGWGNVKTLFTCHGLWDQQGPSLLPWKSWSDLNKIWNKWCWHYAIVSKLCIASALFSTTDLQELLKLHRVHRASDTCPRNGISKIQCLEQVKEICVAHFLQLKAADFYELHLFIVQANLQPTSGHIIFSSTETVKIRLCETINISSWCGTMHRQSLKHSQQTGHMIYYSNRPLFLNISEL